MGLKIVGNEIHFSSGAWISAYSGVVGLSPELRVHGGYDSSGEDLAMSQQDRRELAEHMIERWSQFRDSPPPDHDT